MSAEKSVSQTSQYLITDPSNLTTVQLLREIQNLKELIFARLDNIDGIIDTAHEDLVRVPTDVQKAVGNLKELHEIRFQDNTRATELMRDVIETRITGMDRAVILLQEATDKLPIKIDEKIQALRLVHEEKFISIQKQFQERDVRTEQSSKDSKVAVDAALQAAKEAVNAQQLANQQAAAKSESNFTKQIDQMSLLITQGNNALGGNINDIKERLTKIEGMNLGAKDNRSEEKDNRSAAQGANQYVLAIIGLLVGAALTLIGMFLR